MNYSLKFYLDRPSTEEKSKEEKSIYYYITWKGDRLRKSTEKKCRQCDWIGQRVNTKMEYSLKVNPELTDIEHRIEKFFEKATVPPTPKQVEAIVKGITIREEKDFLVLLAKFIKDSEDGKRKSKKGKTIKSDRIGIYKYAEKLLKDFQEKKEYDLYWANINDDFYTQFSNFLWDDSKLFDNSVGTVINTVKTFLNWAADEKFIPNKIYNQRWVTWNEEIDFVVLYPDELTFLFKTKAEGKLEETKDTFLAGCMTCLRVSNLLSLEREYYTGGKLKVISAKTGKTMLIDVPPALDEIFNKYPNLLPPNNKRQFNKDLKKLGKWYKEKILEADLKKGFIGNSWDSKFIRIRRKRGEAVSIPIDMANVISSHTMRRTGITSLLIMGLSETEVKSISGHDLSSRSFAKYIKIAEQFLSKKSNEAWNKVF